MCSRSCSCFHSSAELIRATASGRGVAKTENRAAFVRASVAQERGALSTCINTRNKRFVYCRARLFWSVYSMQYACTSNRNGIHQRAHGVVVSHPLRMRKALGSIPSVSKCLVSSCLVMVATLAAALTSLSRSVHIHASARTRTQVTSMAAMYSTTRPLMRCFRSKR